MTKQLLIATSFALFLTGCASTAHTFKADQCVNADWEHIGKQDGAMGASSQRFLHYQKTCQGTNAPDKALWEQGRQQGLTQYCTKTNAYELGRTGRTLNGICENNLEELHHANMMGLQQYEISERIDYLRFGQYGYGYFSPWSPFWW